MKSRRALLSAALAATAIAPLTALAQSKPPIKLIVGYAPGGSADAVARMVAEKLKDFLGISVIVDNKPGAGGQLAADFVRMAPADGNTLLVANTHMMVMLPLTTRSAKYNPIADFSPVTRMTSFYEAVALSPNVPATTVPQWLDVVRRDASAGNFGVPAPGSIAHFLGYRLGQDNKVALQAIPYKGAAPLVQDLLGGQIRAGVLPILDVAQHQPTGKIKVLAVNGSKRAQLLPSVPTLQELGIHGFEQLEWTALLAPARTPKPLVDQLNAAVGKALALPELQDKLLKLGMESHPSTPDELERLITSDLASWGPVVKASGFTAD